MNSIHFHFNGDVNINLSLPDSADRPGYKKLVDSLEDYLHDAAEEAAVTEAEADSIVMVMRPDKTPEIMQETQCWEEIESKGKYDCLEVVSDDALDVAGLAIVFDGRRVLNLGRERYLLGPVIVYKYDEDGDGVSLSAEDVIAAVGKRVQGTVCRPLPGGIRCRQSVHPQRPLHQPHRDPGNL